MRRASSDRVGMRRRYRYGAPVFGFHPVNLAFRFLLEVAALLALGFGTYAIVSDALPTALAWVVALAVPLVAATAWATFNVPGDKSRSGEAPVPVPGIVRLLVEFNVFVVAVVLVWFASPTAAVVLALAVLVHYALSIDRIRWLVAAR